MTHPHAGLAIPGNLLRDLHPHPHCGSTLRAVIIQMAAPGRCIGHLLRVPSLGFIALTIIPVNSSSMSPFHNTSFFFPFTGPAHLTPPNLAVTPLPGPHVLVLSHPHGKSPLWRHHHLPPPWPCNTTARCCSICHMSHRRKTRNRCHHASYCSEPQLNPGCGHQSFGCPSQLWVLFSSSLFKLSPLPSCLHPLTTTLLSPVPLSSNDPFSYLMENSEN